MKEALELSLRIITMEKKKRKNSTAYEESGKETDRTAKLSLSENPPSSLLASPSAEEFTWIPGMPRHMPLVFVLHPPVTALLFHSTS